MSPGTIQIPDWPLPAAGSQVRLSENQLQSIDSFIQSHTLDSAFQTRIEPLYLPMAAWIAEQHSGPKPLFLGINGAQGSGKSTLTGLLELLLTESFNKRVISLSIDDLYLGKSERQQLSEDVHPLFITRGVPGTHDVNTGIRLFTEIKENTAGKVIEIPQFNKATDDRIPAASWKPCQLPVDIVLFEGWCVGATAQAEHDLQQPANELEAQEDVDGRWRTMVNNYLAGAYQEWFGFIDIMFMLAVPSMEQVYEWRGLQEAKLKSTAADTTAAGIMDNINLKRFIMHYERLTRHQLSTMPSQVDVYMPLDEQHQIADIRVKPAP